MAFIITFSELDAEALLLEQHATERKEGVFIANNTQAPSLWPEACAAWGQLLGRICLADQTS